MLFAKPRVPRSSGLEAASLLNKASYAKAVNVKSGISGWANAGLPVQK